MQLCIECISDEALKQHASNLSYGRAFCNVCNAESIHIDTDLLMDVFLGLFQYYVNNEAGGTSFAECLLEDWRIFTQHLPYRDVDVINSIFPGDSLNPPTWKRRENADIKASWDSFSFDIKHKNRFFFEHPFADIINDEVWKLLEFSIPVETRLFRARVNKPNGRYYNKSMGKPPMEKVKAGRANPEGIPYLYLASDRDTAIAEVRPAKHQSVTVGYYKICEKIPIIRFKKLTPFDVILADIETIDYSKINQLIDLLIDYLSQPINPLLTDLEYLTTQYICERIKSLGYKGVSYPSAMGPGTNYALFDSDNVCNCQTTRVFYISELRYQIT